MYIPKQCVRDKCKINYRRYLDSSAKHIWGPKILSLFTLGILFTELSRMIKSLARANQQRLYLLLITWAEYCSCYAAGRAKREKLLKWTMHIHLMHIHTEDSRSYNCPTQNLNNTRNSRKKMMKGQNSFN